MEVYETFVTDPNGLQKAFKTIREHTIPSRFDRDFLKSLGFEKPNSVLYVSLFKSLGLVDDDEYPVKSVYSMFTKTETQSKKLIAHQMVNETYAQVFAEDKNAHKLPDKEIHALFKKLMGPNKSKTVVQLVTNTFRALVEYADWNRMQSEHSSNETATNNGVLSVNNNKNGTTPHEEFIHELINDCSEHTYPRENHDSVTVHENKSEVLSTGENDNHPSNGQKNGSPTHSINGVTDQSNNKSRSQSDYIAEALFRRAVLLKKLGRPGEAIKAYNDIISCAEEKNYRIDTDKLLKVYLQKAKTLESIDKYDEALTTYNHIIKRFSDPG